VSVKRALRERWWSVGAAFRQRRRGGRVRFVPLPASAEPAPKARGFADGLVGACRHLPGQLVENLSGFGHGATMEAPSVFGKGERAYMIWINKFLRKT